MGFMNKLYIGGEWRRHQMGVLSVLNPADESVITTVSSGTTDDAVACINAAACIR